MCEAVNFGRQSSTREQEMHHLPYTGGGVLPEAKSLCIAWHASTTRERSAVVISTWCRTLFFTQKQRALCNPDFKHLFKAECLKAKLGRVPGEILCRPALVFHGKRHPLPSNIWKVRSKCRIGNAPELDYVCNAGDAQFKGTQAQRANDANRAARLVDSAVRLFVQNLSLGSETVVQPLLLDMQKGETPGAMEILPHG